MTLTLALTLLAVFIVTEGFFSGSELAMVSADRLRLKARAEDGDRGSKLVLEMLSKPSHLLGTCLIGTNISAVSSSTVVTAAMVHAWGDDVGGLLAVATLVPMVLLFGELIPKSIFETYANTLAPRVVFPLYVFSVLFFPALKLLELITDTLRRTLGVSGEGQAISREVIQNLLDNERTTALDEGDRELMLRVFEFSSATVEDVMKPLIEVVSMPESATAAEAIALMVEHGYSRMPIFQDRVDQVTGMLHHNDLLFLNDLSTPIREVARSAIFVPESKKIEELFQEMRRTRQRVVVPVDEYGGAVGLLTMEDILEELVGEIDDEYDERTRVARKVGPDTWVISARAEAELLDSALGFELPEGDFDTLAGLILVRLGHVPKVGEKILEGPWELVVHKANDRAILEVKMRRLDAPKRADRTASVERPG